MPTLDILAAQQCLKDGNLYLHTRDMSGFTRENSERIGFAVSCLFTQALSVSEMRQWAVKVLEELDNPPPYLVDLMDFDAPLGKLYEIIGFAPHWQHSDEARLALYGIAHKRGRQAFDCPLSREEALQILAQHAEVETRFRNEFPFVSF